MQRPRTGPKQLLAVFRLSEFSTASYPSSSLILSLTLSFLPPYLFSLLESLSGRRNFFYQAGAQEMKTNKLSRGSKNGGWTAKSTCVSFRKKQLVNPEQQDSGPDSFTSGVYEPSDLPTVPISKSVLNSEKDLGGTPKPTSKKRAQRSTNPDISSCDKGRPRKQGKE